MTKGSGWGRIYFPTDAPQGEVVRFSLDLFLPMGAWLNLRRRSEKRKKTKVCAESTNCFTYFDLVAGVIPFGSGSLHAFAKGICLRRATNSPGFYTHPPFARGYHLIFVGTLTPDTLRSWTRLCTPGTYCDTGHLAVVDTLHRYSSGIPETIGAVILEEVRSVLSVGCGVIQSPGLPEENASGCSRVG